MSPHLKIAARQSADNGFVVGWVRKRHTRQADCQLAFLPFYTLRLKRLCADSLDTR